MNKRNELAQKAHANAVAKGFYNEELSNEHYLMLIISEVAELVEADRKELHANVRAFERMYDLEMDPTFSFRHMYNRDTTYSAFAQHIKNTKEDEFADIAIRLYDLAGYLGVDLRGISVSFRATPISEMTFTENAFRLIRGLTKNEVSVHSIDWALNYVYEWAKHENVALDFFITHKMRYNESREALHGKKY